MSVKKLARLVRHGGFLLAVSAVVSKALGLLRDRLMIDIWGLGQETDIISASFRIPDFFFALLIGGTVASVFLPRMADITKREQNIFFSSFLWIVVLIFGVFCGLGALFAPELSDLFARGFDDGLRGQLIPLVRILFVSVFLLSLSSVFGAFVQYKEKFMSIAIAPILYTGSIVLSLYWFTDVYGLMAVGYGAVVGALAHWLMNLIAFGYWGGCISLVWKKPLGIWKGFWADCGRRVMNASVFQINLTMDIVMASFLPLGAVTSTALGSNLGHVLLSVLGVPAGRSVFPQLTKHKHNYEKQKALIMRALWWIWRLTIPASIIGAVAGMWLLGFFFALDGDGLRNTFLVFLPTVLTLPLVCSIPILARLFLANDDTKTPLMINTISLLGAICVAATFTFVILPPAYAILGLGLGNAFSNIFSAVAYGVLARKKYFANL